MSAADCREGRCSCAAKSERIPDTGRTVVSHFEFGWIQDDGTYEWSGRLHTAHISPVWAQHLENRDRGEGYIEDRDGWLIRARSVNVPGSIMRIRWEKPDA